LLGRYDEFPTSASRFAQFVYLDSVHKLQAAIAQAMYKLNQQPINLASLTTASPPNCYVNFEFGIADTDAFYYLDQEQLNALEKALKAQPLAILDVFCAARYYVRKEKGKNRPLPFDYSVLRFIFENEDIELLLHYIRGNQRIPRKDFILFLKNQIDKELIEKQLETWTLKSLF